MTIPRWQAFDRFVRSAEQIVVGEVTKALSANSADLITGFRFRVDEVLRGTGPSEIVFELPVVQSRSYCATALSVHVGDRLTLALERRIGPHPHVRSSGSLSSWADDSGVAALWHPLVGCPWGTPQAV